jgi:hypothetical protein
MKKSSKRFPINTEVINGNGFRVSTAGIDLSHFNLNPLLLWMHKRPKGESKDEILPLGYWEDVELRDGQLTGIPVFDDEDDFAMKIYKKVENGSIRAGSAGLKPVLFEMKDGEKWLEKSILKEASICDMGSNHESVSVVLYDDNDQLITLSEAYNQTFNSNKPDMKLIELSAETMPLLNLQEGATGVEAHAAIQNLITLAETQKAEMDGVKATNKELLEKIELSETASKTEKIIGLVDKAVTDRKITADQKPSMVKLAEADFDSTKAYLDGLTPAPTVASQVGKDTKKDEALVNLSWKELEGQGKLIQLREGNFEIFAEKFKVEFGTDYKK